MPEASAPPVTCPICNDPVDGDLEGHLLSCHAKGEVVDELLRYLEAEDVA